MKYKIFAYNPRSQGARELRRRLGCLMIRHTGRYRGFRNHAIINWGSSGLPIWEQRVGEVLNNPEAVLFSTNKLRTFEVLSWANISVPPWTTEIREAQEWLQKGKKVVCRTILNGHSGNGIVIVIDNGLVHAPLYTQYVPKKKEFRIHVFRGRVIDRQEKRRRRGNIQVDNYVRSYANGWVFCRDNLVLPDGIDQLAINTVEALGLDFGAVDIIWNEHYNKCYVLEVNSAPGIEGSTADNYARAFTNYKENLI